MEAKKLEIQTLSVQIKVLTVDQKRFTKSVFDQLPEIDGIIENHNSLIYDFELRYPCIGYVKIKTIHDPYPQDIALFLVGNNLFKSLNPNYMDHAKAHFYKYGVIEQHDQLFISI